MGLKASNCRWKIAIEELQMKSWELRVRNELLQMKGCDLWAATEGLSLNGCNQKTRPKKDCRLSTEGLRLNDCNWILGNECERLQVKGWDRSCDPKPGTEGKGLQLKDRNWSVKTEWLSLKGCNWKLENESLGLKTNVT